MTDDSLQRVIDFLTKYNKWRRRNDDDDSEFIEMPLPRDIGIAIDTAIEHLTAALSAQTGARDAERYRAWRLMALTGMPDNIVDMVMKAKTENDYDKAIDQAIDAEPSND